MNRRPLPPSSRFTRRSGRPGSGRPPAFTLLELLVVIGIIGLLLAMLLPSIVAAKQQARRVACQSNLKQIVFGWQAYLNSTRGKFPSHLLADINYGGRQGAAPVYSGPKFLNRSLRLPEIAVQAEVFACPSDTGLVRDANAAAPGQGDDAKLARPSCYAHFGTSYFANPLLVGDSQVVLFSSVDPCAKLNKQLSTALASLSLDRIDTPSRLLLVGDAAWTTAWSLGTKDPLVAWHNQALRYNVGFIDGHADFVEIYRGCRVSAAYTVMPFASLQREAAQCQPPRRR